MIRSREIRVLPGDGLGRQVVEQVQKIIAWMNHELSAGFEVEVEHIGSSSIDRYGTALADSVLDAAMNADAVLLGAVGGPKRNHIEFASRPEAALLRLRGDLGLFANLRPIAIFNALVDASTVKAEHIKGVDIVIVRELTGGIYFGEPRGIEQLPDGRKRGVNTHVYTTSEIRRIARLAFDLARTSSASSAWIIGAPYAPRERRWIASIFPVNDNLRPARAAAADRQA